MATKTTKLQLEAELKQAQERISHLENKLKSVKPDKGKSGESREAFNSLFKNHTIPMWLYDINTLKFLDVNDAAIQKYGYSYEEFLSMTIKDIRPAEDVPQLVKNLSKKRPALESSGDWRHKLKDGSVINVEVTSHTLEYEGHNSALVMAQDITERKQSDDQLSLSDQFLQRVNALIIVADSKGDVVYVSPAAKNILGYEPAELMGDNWWKLSRSNPIDAQREKEYVAQVARGEIPISIEAYERSLQDRWGNTRWVSWVDAAGPNNSLIGVGHDITERKQMEESLSESERQYRQMIETAQEGVWVIDIENRTTLVNQSLAEMLGYTIEEMLGRTLYDFMDEEGKAIAVNNLEVHRRQGIDEQLDLKFVHKDGSILWAFIKTSSLFDRNGTYIGALAMVTDITERKLEEELLLRNQATLLHAERMAHLGAWEIKYNNYEDLDANPLTWSNEVYRIFGYEPGEMEVSSPMFFAHIHPDDRQRIMDAVHLVWTEKKSYELEYRIISGTGHERILTEYAEILFDEQGRPLHMLGAVQDITERKQMESALARSEKEYRTLFENVPVGLYRSSEDGRMLDANPALIKMFGYEDQASFLATRTIDLYVNPDSKARFQNEIKNNDTIHNFVAEFHRKDGTTFWAEENTQIIRDQDGNPLFYEGSLIDITDRKQSQDALHESDERFKSAFQYSAIGMSLGSLEGRWLKVNPKLCLMVGYSEEELLTKTFQDITHPDDLEGDLKHVRELLDGEIESFTMEKRYIHKEGKFVWVMLAVALAKDSSGKPLYFISQVEDISDRKLAEEKLLESERQYRELYSNMPAMFFTIDENGTTLSVNDFGAEQLGYTQEELVGQTVLKVFYEADKDQAVSYVKNCLEHPQQTFQWELRKVRKNGSMLWVKETAWAVTNQDGNPIVLIVCEDITERKQAEIERQTLLEIMEGANTMEELHEFLALVHRSISGVLNAENFFVTLYNNNTKLFEEVYSADQYDPPIEPYKLEHSISAYVFRNGEPLLLTSAMFEEMRASGEIELVGRMAASWLGVPLNTSKETIGVMAVQDYVNTDRYSEHSRDFLASVAGQVALAVQRIRAERENKYQLSELEVLYENGLAISRILEPKRIAERMVEVLDQYMDWHHAAVRLYDPENDRLELLALNFPGFNEAQTIEQIDRINQAINNPDTGLSGWVIRHGKAIRIGNLKGDPRYFETYKNINSGLYVPIQSGDEIIGSIAVESDKVDAFTERDEHLLSTLANQAAVSFINARLYLRIQEELDERHRAQQEVRKLNIELEQRVQERTTQIEATKRRLELATHAGQIGVWEYNPRENTVIWDERMHMIHGIAPSEAPSNSQDWAKVIHPDDLELSQLNIQLAVTKNLLSNNEYRIIWPNGSIRNVATSAVTVFSPEGIADRIIGITMDITERKQIEQSLRDSETYARLLFDAAPDPLSVIEVNGRIVDVNQVFEKQHAVLRDEIHGKYLSELGLFPPLETIKAENYLSEIAVGHTVAPSEINFYAPKDGIHTLELHSYPIEVNGKQLILSTSRDITTHKKAEDTLRLANTEMERALHIKDEFLANMSHELRTPLNSILGISESLEEQIAGALNEKQLKYVRIVRDSGRHLLELINDILDISKIEAGRMDLDFHNISVESLCQSSLGLIKELAQKKNVQVSYTVKGDAKVILGDQRRLKQSLVNLLSNAVKFTPPGNGIGLEVNGHPDTNEVTFTVWDQGVGIAESDIQYLFKPFVQLDAGLTREYAGTGLGLALVAQMIRLHGGRVSVESELGKGSRFTITLPWMTDEQKAKAKVTAELLLPSPRLEEKRNGKILVVEDTNVIVNLMNEYLLHKGYEVLIARNGVEGIKLAKQEHPDLILMDVMMPIMDGLEATKQIRTDKTMQDIPIIALTALAMPGDRDRCIAAGMTDYMSKPVQMQDLAFMIKKYLYPEKAEKK